MTDEKIIGLRIRSFWDNNGHKPKGFRDHLMDKGELDSGITVGTLSKVQAGKMLPPIELLIAMDAADFATPDMVLFGEERLPIFQLQEIVQRMDTKAFEKFADACSSLTSEPKDYGEIWIAERFREIRKREGLSLAATADRLSVNINTVNWHEKTDSLPRTRYLFKFCREFNVSAAYILGVNKKLPARLRPLQELIYDCSLDEQSSFIRRFEEISKNF